jgi:hypothetical protein
MPQAPIAFRRLPLSLAWYSDGLAVTAAAAPYRDAIGRRVARIGRLTPAELEAAIAPYVSYETNLWLHLQSPTFMVIHDLLESLGQTDTDGRVTIAFDDGSGGTRTIGVESVAWTGGPALVSATDALGIPTPLARKQPASHYWFERLPERRALYIQHNRCGDDPARPFAALAADLFQDADAHAGEINRVVVDLRYNGGGNSEIIKPLIEGLKKRKGLSGRGRLFGLVGPNTFSSGLMAAAELRKLKAVMIGEPSGEPLNSYGEVRH